MGSKAYPGPDEAGNEKYYRDDDDRDDDHGDDTADDETDLEVGCYVRVSTEDQDLERQLSSTTDHAIDVVGADLPNLEVWRDKSTGTDTDRSGFREMMAAVEAGDVDVVVVDEVSRVARSIRDLEDTIDRFEDAGVSIHFVSSGLEFDPDDDDPFSRALLQLLGVFAELEASMTRARIRDGIAARQAAGKAVGQPPMGMRIEDGMLVAGDDFDRVVTVLEAVVAGDMSKRHAADELGCVRATIRSALSRPEMYGLDEDLAEAALDVPAHGGPESQL